MQNPILWAEIDLDAISSNIRELRRMIRSETAMMAVVKADGYGHGAAEIAREALNTGARYLGVARTEEGVRLRKSGLSAPILVFGFTPKDSFHDLVRYDLTQSAWSYESCAGLSEFATLSGKPIKVHIKIDTGMGRLGICAGTFPPYPASLESMNEKRKELESIFRLPGLIREGIFTHFATADSPDKTYANAQFETFMEFLELLKRSQMEFSLRHAANSAALIEMPETHLDLVRPGISLYGLYPSPTTDRSRIKLYPAMTLKTRIIHLKEVSSGFKVSYGITCQTEKRTRIATLPLGYADGYDRGLSSRGYVLIRGVKAPIMGRVCMDLTMCDVGHIPGVSLNDEVVVFGRQGTEAVSIDRIAEMLDTINYEIVTSISVRVPRVYIRSNESHAPDQG
ncbi:MAG: alanine racemase [Thermodesulfobacteriota bacterium]